jgi:hypothetical protein
MVVGIFQCIPSIVNRSHGARSAISSLTKPLSHTPCDSTYSLSIKRDTGVTNNTLEHSVSETRRQV